MPDWFYLLLAVCFAPALIFSMVMIVIAAYDISHGRDPSERSKADNFL